MRTPTAGGSREAVLNLLHEKKVISDPNGRATGLLFDAINYKGSSSGLSQLLTNMERDGLITRKINGKRCYQIRLVEDVPPPSSGTATVVSNPPPMTSMWRQEAATPQAPAPAAPAAAPEPEPSGPMPSAQDIAAALLSKVLEQAARPIEYEEMKKRLAVVLDENQRLRTKAREAEDLNVARQQEIAGLRQRIVELQRTLDQISTNGDFRVTESNLKRLRDLTNLMTQAPSAKR